jgi:hypothetical protein
MSRVDLAPGLARSLALCQWLVRRQRPRRALVACGADADFARVEWNAAVEVETITLDGLMAQHGEPAFITIDSEGGELASLAGVSRTVRVVSCEVWPQALAAAAGCADRLHALGLTRHGDVYAQQHG